MRPTRLCHPVLKVFVTRVYSALRTLAASIIQELQMLISHIHARVENRKPRVFLQTVALENLHQRLETQRLSPFSASASVITLAMH
jgi:hypothetical protein